LRPTEALPLALFHTGVSATESGDALVAGGSFVDFTTQATLVTAESFVFRTAQENWQPLAPLPSPIRCGVIGCFRYFKKDDSGQVVSCVAYLMAGGLRMLDLASGAALPSQDIVQMDEGLTGWTLAGSTLVPRMGVGFAPIDEGLRVLISGSAGLLGGVLDRTAETYTIVQ
jgi:hypothetical protein